MPVKKNTSAKTVARIVASRAAGQKIRSIAREVGLSEGTVRYWLMRDTCEPGEILGGKWWKGPRRRKKVGEDLIKKLIVDGTIPADSVPHTREIG